MRHPPRCGAHGRRQVRTDEARAALQIDLRGGSLVIVGESGVFLGAGLLEHGHGILQTRVARGLAASRERDIEREVVDVRVGGGGSVRDGVGEAVGGGGGIAEAGRRVEGSVGQETEVRLLDDGILVREVGAAVCGEGEVRGEVGHIRRADGGIGGAGCIEGLGDAEEGFGGLEEGVGVLF